MQQSSRCDGFYSTHSSSLSPTSPPTHLRTEIWVFSTNSGWSILKPQAEMRSGLQSSGKLTASFFSFSNFRPSTLTDVIRGHLSEFRQLPLEATKGFIQLYTNTPQHLKTELPWNDVLLSFMWNIPAETGCWGGIIPNWKPIKVRQTQILFLLVQVEVTKENSLPSRNDPVLHEAKAFIWWGLYGRTRWSKQRCGLKPCW